MTRRMYGWAVIGLSGLWLIAMIVDLIRGWGIRESSLALPILPVALIGFGLFFVRNPAADIRLTWREAATLIGILAVPVVAVFATMAVLSWAGK